MKKLRVNLSNNWRNTSTIIKTAHSDIGCQEIQEAAKTKVTFINDLHQNVNKNQWITGVFIELMDSWKLMSSYLEEDKELG